jgi:HEAT repeat protein
MLSYSALPWIANGALAAMAVLAILCLVLPIWRLAGNARAAYVRSRKRELLPLLLHGVEDPSWAPAIRDAMLPFDRGLVLDLLMRLAIDVREEEGTEIVRLCGELGLVDREIRALSSPRSRARRRAAANLGLLRQASALPVLIGLVDGRNTNVRLAAIDAIADIGCHRGLAALIPRIGDPDHAVSWRIQEALARGGCDVGAELVRFIGRELDPRARDAALRVLRWVNPSKADLRLCAFARAGSPFVRMQIARALTDLGSDRATEVLQALLRDPSADVRTAAVRGLGTLRREATVPSLCSNLRDDSNRVRVEVARSLAQLGHPGITALLRFLGPRLAPADAPRATRFAQPAGSRAA